MVVSSVQAVIAQRLLRRVCESCSEPYSPTPQEIIWMEMEGLSNEQWGGLKSGRGCTHCNGTGYYGRMGVYEMLEMNSEMAHAAAHEDATQFVQVVSEHMHGKTMLYHALQEMTRGHTTVSEVMSISNRVED
jgi:MSHA biogenesis protein MshE